MKCIITIIFTIVVSIMPALAQQPYWQQTVNTQIEVTLDDKSHFLRGKEIITYQNNSPDTLRYLYLHLWPNAYKHDHTPFAEQQYEQKNTKFYYAKASQRGFIDSLNFEINGNSLDYLSAPNTPDIARINLLHPLLPGETITISTPFRVKIPAMFSRLGHSGQAYYISQWFPKPAVYDRKGWHPISYLDQGEFYSEYGSYDVRITLPQNYIVMATGNMMDATERNWIDSLATLQPILSKKQSSDSFPPSSTTWKTIRFYEENVHDFAWFADKRYLVRKDSFRYDQDTTLPAITIYTAFLPKSINSWSKSTQHLKDALNVYGNSVGRYPYKTIKAVQGDMNAGGGMEYPTITVIDQSVGGSKTVIVHEAGHNWYYGILGSNERQHAWMDEGINSYYEARTIAQTSDSALPKKGISVNSVDGISISYQLYHPFIAQLAASHTDQAINQTAENFKSMNYGLDVYYKTAWYLQWLEDYMGTANFDAGMQEYFQTWKFKHPYPEDFREIMSRHTEQPLDWFFDGLLNTTERIDFSIKKIKQQPNETLVRVRNHSGIALPASLEIKQNDSTTSKIQIPPFVKDTLITIATPHKGIRISEAVADMKTQNNQPFRGIQLRPIAGLNNAAKQKTFWLPAMGYNIYDGFGLGLIWHNISLPENKFRFILMPTYSFHSKQLTGAGTIAYVTHPQKYFQEVTAQLDVKSYHYNSSKVNIPQPLFTRYIKCAPSVSFQLKEASIKSTVQRTLLVKGYAISEDVFTYYQNPIDSLYRPQKSKSQQYYGLLRYTHQNNRTFNPFSYEVAGQVGKTFIKMTAAANVRIDYHLPNKSLYLRGFFGKFIALHNTPSYTNDRYLLNSTSANQYDYLYDQTYFGRSEQKGWTSQQIAMQEGGLKIPTPFLSSPLGRSDNWLASINIKSDLPIRLPIRLFIDVATFADVGKLNPSGNKILFDAGIEWHYEDWININIPLFMSRDYKDYFNTIVVKDKFFRSITFSMQLDKIRWINAGSEIIKWSGN